MAPCLLCTMVPARQLLLARVHHNSAKLQRELQPVLLGCCVCSKSLEQPQGLPTP